MFKSIIEDVKINYQNGNMLTRIIMVNVFVFVVINLLFAFTQNINNGAFFQSIITNLGLPSDLSVFIWKPWTIVSHMFVHQGFWHILWNMLLLYWFGRIVGDLIGDRHIVPLYIFAGIFAGFIYIIGSLLFSNVGGSFAIGASGSVMAFVLLAAFIAPDYLMHLILIGPVKIKYIALAILFMDIVGASGNINSGGHIAHLGGALFGWIYGTSLIRGVDLSQKFNAVADRPRKPKRHLKVKYKSSEERQESGDRTGFAQEARLNKILEKIKRDGYDKLSREEKEFLFLASKK